MKNNTESQKPRYIYSEQHIDDKHIIFRLTTDSSESNIINIEDGSTREKRAQARETFLNKYGRLL